MDNIRLSSEEKLAYMDLKTRLIECESMPVAQLIERAFRIKPIIRLQESLDNDYVPVIGNFCNDDKLYFLRPHDLRQSYLYDFNPRMLSRSHGKPLPVDTAKLTKINEFTCYHRYGGYPAFLRPGVNEVLTQIPELIDIDSVNLFELKFESDQVYDVYDSVIDRHVSTVILYSYEGGLPSVIKNQDVIYDTARYQR